MTHFARRLSEILASRPKRTRAQIERELANAAREQTRAARQKHQAIRACRRVP